MFRRLQRLATALLRREDGPTAVEYAVMLALVLMALIAGIAQIGGLTSTMFNDLSLHTSLKMGQ